MLEMAKELEKTLHIHSPELPYIEVGTGTEARILVARQEEGIFAIQFRAQPFVKSPLHRHDRPVLGYTLRGQWGHDEQYLYRPGTMIYETPGVIHQFINGPEVTEAIFFGDPDLEFIDPETLKEKGRYSATDMISGYIATCATLGIEPRFL
jgi:quercetin dioxygenase-like cupin family protein